MTLSPELIMNDGVAIPQLGLGVWQMSDDEAYAAIRHAITVGYRHIDTAAIYKNEAATGRAIRDAIAAGDVTREELFVTTKLWNNQQHEAAVGFDQSMERLGLDYVDLYLIHWPFAAQDTYLTAWKDLVALREDPRLVSIGVANFYPETLNNIIDATGVTPAVNQIELHPGLSQPELRVFDAQHSILTQAWSPLGQGQSIADPALVAIADELGRTPAQVILRWQLQLGNVVIPKSKTPARIEENFQVFDFSLSDQQMAVITGLDNPAGRIGPDPAEWPTLD